MKENIKLSELVANLSDYDKLRLYDFILCLYGDNGINQVYYTAKNYRSQAENCKKPKICSKSKNKTNHNS